MFYYCTQYCNSVRMTCSIKRLLILSYYINAISDRSFASRAALTESLQCLRGGYD